MTDLFYNASWTMIIQEGTIERVHIVHNVKTPYRQPEQLRNDKDMISRVILVSKMQRGAFKIDNQTKLPKVREIEFLNPLTANFEGHDGIHMEPVAD